MTDGVTGREGFGFGLERSRYESDRGPIATPWWRRWAYSPVSLATTLVRPSQTTDDGLDSGEQNYLPRVHAAHPGPGRSDRKPATKPGRRSWDSARCLITGASSGLGKALGERLVRAGAHVVLTGRSTERLQAVAQGLIGEGADHTRIITIPADLTIEIDRQRLFDEVTERFQALDMVINSAGVGAAGQFETHEPTVLRQVFEINVFALAEVCRAALPLLIRGRQPVLVNMGSIVARRGLPGRTEYSASKFAVTGLTEAIRVEWRRFGIHVLQVNPGFTDTPFEWNAVVNTARYSVAHHRIMSANAVAAATLRAVVHRKREITLTRQGRLVILVGALAPRFVDWGFGRWLRRYYPDAIVPQTCYANCLNSD
jgi:short-subunit dehydrogenase